MKQIYIKMKLTLNSRENPTPNQKFIFYFRIFDVTQDRSMNKNIMSKKSVTWRDI